MSKALKILLLEDSSLDARLILREINKANIICNTLTVNNKTDYIDGLKKFGPDIILSDHTLPTINSVEALKLAIGTRGKIPFILVTGTMTEDFAVEIMKQGAWDYVPKNNMERLPDAINKAQDKYDQERHRQNFFYDLIRNEAHMVEVEHMVKYGSWEVDILPGKIKLSKEAYTILGYLVGDADMLMENMLNIVHPDELPRVHLLIKNILNDPELTDYNDNFRLTDTNGVYRLIKAEFVIKRNTQGKPVKINGIIQNVTHSELLEERLFESENRFLELANSLEMSAVFTLDASGCVIGTNNEGCKVFEYNDDDIINKHLSILYENKETLNHNLVSYFATSNDGQFKTAGFFETKTGAGLEGEVIVTGLKNNKGKLSGFLVVINNITMKRALV